MTDKLYNGFREGRAPGDHKPNNQVRGMTQETMTKEQILWNLIIKDPNYIYDFKDYDEFLNEVKNIHGQRILAAMSDWEQQQLSAERERFEELALKSIDLGLKNQEIIIKYAAERERAGKLVEALNDYIVLLGEEIDEIVFYANSHGWKSKRFEKGEELRQNIKQTASAYQENTNPSS